MASPPDLQALGVHRRIPLWLKIAYTLFAIFFVAVQLDATPLLLLWFCNAAVVIVLVGLWLDSPLLLSMQILAVFVPQLFWQIDYLAQAAIGHKLFAVCGLTPADYMFEPGYPLLRRIASFQHAWMPWFLLWLLWRIGYDTRALAYQTAFAWTMLLLTLLFVPDMHDAAGNVNYIFIPSQIQPQAWMPQWAWILVLMVLLPVCQYAPLHHLLLRISTSRKTPGRDVH